MTSTDLRRPLSKSIKALIRNKWCNDFWSQFHQTKHLLDFPPIAGYRIIPIDPPTYVSRKGKIPGAVLFFNSDHDLTTARTVIGRWNLEAGSMRVAAIDMISKFRNTELVDAFCHALFRRHDARS